VTITGGDTSVDEGQSKTYTYTVTDPGQDTLTIVESCGTAGTRTDTLAVNSFDCTFPDGPASSTVKVTANDEDPGAASEATRLVTVANVSPGVTITSFSVDPASGSVISSVNWADPGVDTETVVVTYTRGAFVASQTFSGKPASGVLTDTTTQIPPGCGPITMAVTVTDSDLASGSDTRTATTSDVYTASFDAPIMQNERNIAKYGNVVPVKVRLAGSCSGSLVTSPTLFLTVSQGTVLDTYGDEIIVTSVSSADTDQQMRPVDGKYMYNLSTKGNFQANTNYEIRIRVGSLTGPIIARAHLYPKK
jgi:hypothetical protein